MPSRSWIEDMGTREPATRFPTTLLPPRIGSVRLQRRHRRRALAPTPRHGVGASSSSSLCPTAASQPPLRAPSALPTARSRPPSDMAGPRPSESQPRRHRWSIIGDTPGHRAVSPFLFPCNYGGKMPVLDLLSTPGVLVVL